MLPIPLNHGKVALVDDADFERVFKLKWHAYLHHGIWYAKHTTPRDANGRQKTVRLHRFVLGLTLPYPLVDHRDRDGLNNQRSNLRVCTTRQNGANSKPRSRSGFKGVYFVGQINPKRPWLAQIARGKKSKHIGYYTTPEAAAEAYDIVAREMFGEFARTNFPVCDCMDCSINGEPTH